MRRQCQQDSCFQLPGFRVRTWLLWGDPWKPKVILPSFHLLLMDNLRCGQHHIPAHFIQILYTKYGCWSYLTRSECSGLTHTMTWGRFLAFSYFPEQLVVSKKHVSHVAWGLTLFVTGPCWEKHKTDRKWLGFIFCFTTLTLFQPPSIWLKRVPIKTMHVEQYGKTKEVDIANTCSSPPEFV